VEIIGHDVDPVGDLRNWLLLYETDTVALTKVSPGLTPEIVAAVSKIMRNQDLILVAKKCSVVTKFRNTLGLPGHLSVRLQPNHPTDDLKGIAASTLEGLLYGCGDAVIGINPASDHVITIENILRMMDDLIRTYNIPTQSCVLGHVTTQMDAMKRGVPIDLVFQSTAGTEKAAAIIQEHFEFLQIILKISFSEALNKDILAQGELLSTKLFSIYLTEKGYKKCKDLTIFRFSSTHKISELLNALSALYLYKKNIDYTVSNNSIFIIDQLTGRPLQGRKWANGLHEAIETKENLKK
jgi:hypothetical protein